MKESYTDDDNEVGMEKEVNENVRHTGHGEQQYTTGDNIGRIVVGDHEVSENFVDSMP